MRLYVMYVSYVNIHIQVLLYVYVDMLITLFVIQIKELKEREAALQVQQNAGRTIFRTLKRRLATKVLRDTIRKKVVQRVDVISGDVYYYNKENRTKTSKKSTLLVRRYNYTLIIRTIQYKHVII